MAMPGQHSRMGAVWNGRAAAMPKSGNTMPELSMVIDVQYS